MNRLKIPVERKVEKQSLIKRELDILKCNSNPIRGLEELSDLPTKEINSSTPFIQVYSHAVVSCKVELHKDKPQTVIADTKQLTVIYDEDVPASQLPKINQ